MILRLLIKFGEWVDDKLQLGCLEEDPVELELDKILDLCCNMGIVLLPWQIEMLRVWVKQRMGLDDW